MDVNIYCVSGLRQIRKSKGWIMYLLESEVNGQPYTKHWADEIEATKNESGLECVRRALSHLKKADEVTIYTDSDYFYANREKMHEWAAWGWVNPKTGEKRPNWEQWEEIASKLSECRYEVKKDTHPYTHWMQSELKRISMQMA